MFTVLSTVTGVVSVSISAPFFPRFCRKPGIPHALSRNTRQSMPDITRYMDFFFTVYNPPFIIKEILKRILPLAPLFYNYNPETIAYIVLFSVHNS